MGKRKLDCLIKSKLFSRAVLGGNIELNDKKEEKNS